MKDIITHISLDKDYILKPIRKDRTNKPKFRMFGITQGDNMDLMDYSLTVSKAESRMLVLIKNSILWDQYEQEYVPIVKVKPSSLDITTSEKDVMNRALKKLIDDNIVRKVKPWHYMIDPKLLVPSNYEKYNKIWNDLTDPKLKN